MPSLDKRPSMPNPRCSLCRAREEAHYAEYEMKLTPFPWASTVTNGSAKAEGQLSG